MKSLLHEAPKISLSAAMVKNILKMGLFMMIF